VPRLDTTRALDLDPSPRLALEGILHQLEVPRVIWIVPFWSCDAMRLARFTVSPHRS